MFTLQLDHVQLAAPPGCEPAARDFYGALLRLPELPKPPALAGRGGVWFACGGGQLHIGVEEPFTPARKAHPAFRLASVAELQTVAAALEQAGHPVTWDSSIENTSRFYVPDPWGNRLELLALEV